MDHIYQQRIGRLEQKLAELVTENVKLRDELDTEQRRHDAQVGELQREIEEEVQELMRRQDMVRNGT
jgi:regulator of replication initiation timing